MVRYDGEERLELDDGEMPVAVDVGRAESSENEFQGGRGVVENGAEKLWRRHHHAPQDEAKRLRIRMQRHAVPEGHCLRRPRRLRRHSTRRRRR